jgi:hypothetical protein
MRVMYKLVTRRGTHFIYLHEVCTDKGILRLFVPIDFF